jgi:hypothetical protein
MPETVPNNDGTTSAAPASPNTFDWQQYVERFDEVYKEVGQVLKVFQAQPGQTQSPTTADPKPTPQAKPQSDNSWIWLLLAAVGVYYATK